MMDKTEAETAALAGALKFMAEIIGEIGWDKPAQEWSKEQVERIAEAAIDGFQADLSVARSGAPL